MFTGIIEDLGRVTHLEKEEENLHLTIESSLSSELKVDQSISHNGVCLTVVELGLGSYTVTAIKETLNLTNLGELEIGDGMNLERCMLADGRFDGHIVQGHVDGRATCISIEESGGSHYFRFRCEDDNPLIVHKGSITVNGVSLTVTDVQGSEFSVAIIPYTYDHTTFGKLKVGDQINLEYDIIGKYVAKMIKG